MFKSKKNQSTETTFEASLDKALDNAISEADRQEIYAIFYRHQLADESAA